MGKKLNRVSSPMSKNEKHQFNSLIKVLRPKVYITDPSNFKRLVQELTGNGSKVISAPPPTSTTPSQIVDHHVDVVGVGDQLRVQQENSMEQVMSLDASFYSFDSVWNQVVLNEEIDQTWRQIDEDVMAVDSSVNHCQTMDLLACQEIESWLLDSDDHQQYSTLNYQNHVMATGYAV